MTQNTETIVDNIDKIRPRKTLKAFVHQKYHNEIRKIHNEDIIVMKIYTPSNITTITYHKL